MPTQTLDASLSLLFFEPIVHVLLATLAVLATNIKTDGWHPRRREIACASVSFYLFAGSFALCVQEEKSAFIRNLFCGVLGVCMCMCLAAVVGNVMIERECSSSYEYRKSYPVSPWERPYVCDTDSESEDED
jgi:hypothetical protein